MREIELVESTPCTIDLSIEESKFLENIGIELASKSIWWGLKKSEDQRSVVSLVMQGSGRFKVTFRDVIGSIRFRELQLNISPKIPQNHFNFIVQKSSLAPRFSEHEISIKEGNDYLEILINWFLFAAEGLLRKGLRKDYSYFEDSLPFLRGQVDPLRTTQNFQTGIAEAFCRFEELSENTPLNRAIKEAAIRITGSKSVSEFVRNRAHKISLRMSDVSTFVLSDFHVTLDRLSHDYSEALPLALIIISGLGFDTSANGKLGKSFLIRTPEIIEDGLRNILSNGIKDFLIKKQRLKLGVTGISINPDLIFGSNLAVGDVKYTYFDKDWSRNAFNQIITFATGFRTTKAGVFGFTNKDIASLPRPVKIGDIEARVFAWSADPNSDPETVSNNLISEVKAWIS